jgi:N-acetylglutamate synthase-like GNAT family acetyltransferase
MKLRRAKLEDARKILNLKKKTFKEINSKDYSKKVVDEYVEGQKLSEIVENITNRIIFILEEKGKLLGVVGLNREGLVGSLYIRSDQVGKGYGKKLMIHVENYAKKLGIKKIVLHPTRTAEALYERLGYKTKNKTQDWKIGGEIIKVKEMWKKL